MIVLICPDKFKSSISATELCKVISSELLQINPNIQCINMPMADGGDGTLDVLNENIGLNSIIIKSIDPLGREIYPRYLSDGHTAYIELAEASGIQHLTTDQLDVMNYNTRGTGKVIQHALQLQHREIVLCLGGSCTNDMGFGIAQVLGYQFLDQTGNKLKPSGATLSAIESIIPPTNKIDIPFRILADVKNPLYGPDGAAHTFAKQKGATPKEIELLDHGMRHVAKCIHKAFRKDVSSIPGGGAAGGIAAGLIGLLEDVQLQSGVEFISKSIGLETAIKNADLVITGEGQLDTTSINGKVVGHVAQLCKKHTRLLTIIVGDSTLTNAQAKKAGIDEIHTLISKAPSLEAAIFNPEIYINQIIEEKFSLVQSR